MAPYVHDYGYLAVGLFLLLKNIGIPVPGEAILVTAALVARAGSLDLAVVVAVGFLAAFAGAVIGYALGRYGGHPVVVRYGRRVGITHERLDQLEEFFARHGTTLVLVGRFLPFLRHWTGIAAGISEMPRRRFFLGNAVGAAVWVGLWATVGAQAGGHIVAINTFLERSTPVLIVVLAALVVLLVVRRRRHHGAPIPAVACRWTPDRTPHSASPFPVRGDGPRPQPVAPSISHTATGSSHWSSAASTSTCASRPGKRAGAG